MATQKLDLAVKRITKLDGEGTLKAFCDVAMAGSYLIKGIRVVNGKNGLFVSLPRQQGKDGKWYETVVPLSNEAREQLSTAVMQAYSAKEPGLE